MRIAIVSDSHDHIANLRAAVVYCNSFGVALLIHCGDLISPFMLAELAAFGGAVHLIYGNNPGDQHLITSLCLNRYTSITHHGVMGALEAGGRRIAFQHYPEMARALAAAGHFDLVCCGHNHIYHTEKIGGSLLVNPGELLGKEGQPTFAIVDSASLDVERVEVGRAFF